VVAESMMVRYTTALGFMWLRRAEILRSAIGVRSGIELQGIGVASRLRNESTFRIWRVEGVIT
jgi:hypothetical protein